MVHAVDPVRDFSVRVRLVQHELVVHVSSHDLVVRRVRVAHFLELGGIEIHTRVPLEVELLPNRVRALANR
jgi:hypothetical protein